MRNRSLNKEDLLPGTRMNVFIAATFGLLLAGAAYADIENQSVPDNETEWLSFSLTGRIVNGTKAALRQFPYQVSLRRSYNSRHFCGGSLIDEYYVLTAAHCVFLNGEPILPWTVMVVAGEIQLNQQTPAGQRRGVEEIYVHPRFNQSTLQNDVALLYLKVPFKLTPNITPVIMTTEPPVPNSICQVSGWGYPSYDYPIVSNDLMYVDLPIVEPSVCKKLLVNVTDLLPGMFCAGYMEGQRDACRGDSGGGMICNGVLTGVVSGGEGCALPALPGVYSSVFFFEEWILENMKAPSFLRKATATQLVQSGAEQVNNE
nr:trypsin-2-like [Nomia melanderi]